MAGHDFRTRLHHAGIAGILSVGGQFDAEGFSALSRVACALQAVLQHLKLNVARQAFGLSNGRSSAGEVEIHAEAREGVELILANGRYRIVDEARQVGARVGLGRCLHLRRRLFWRWRGLALFDFRRLGFFNFNQRRWRRFGRGGRFRCEVFRGMHLGAHVRIQFLRRHIGFFRGGFLDGLFEQYLFAQILNIDLIELDVLCVFGFGFLTLQHLLGVGAGCGFLVAFKRAEEMELALQVDEQRQEEQQHERALRQLRHLSLRDVELGHVHDGEAEDQRH